MSSSNFADVWEAVSDALGEEPALRHGERTVTWSQFGRRAEGVAGTLVRASLGRQATVALYLLNCPEFLEATFATFKASLVPANTNYRYTAHELERLWRDADAAAVVFHGTFSDLVAAVRPRLPDVRVWLWVDDRSGPRPEWALDYEAAAAAGPVPLPARDGDDLLLLYTGGTTGLPKGVIWRQHDLYSFYSETLWHDPATPDPDRVRSRLGTRRPVALPASPLMHGTGWFSALQVLSEGGTVVTLPSGRFSAEALLDAIDAYSVTFLVIVGDAFGRPLAEALDAEPERWRLDSLRVVVSSGVMWSEANKRALLAHRPKLTLIDALSSSEALGVAQAVSRGDGAARTSSFTIGERTRVIDDDGRDVGPGTGMMGRLAVRGFLPVGYHKDPEKTARTFITLDGIRYAVPGDYATVEADGTIRLLGRGAMCINTAGEKVFPEEVEEVLKAHPAVADAVVVGVPDARWGEQVAAVVQPSLGETLDEESLLTHARESLAGYKVPRRLLVVPSLKRGPNGKIDYRRWREAAQARGGNRWTKPEWRS